MSGVDTDADADAAREAIRSHEVVHLQVANPLDDLRRYYDALVEAIGEPANIDEDFRRGGAPTGERWLEIRYDPDIPDDEAFRYSKNAQPFHTDESYVSSAVGVILFYCVSAAPAGGETVFISGRQLVEELQAARPELFEQLLTTPVTYRKADDSKHRPIIEIADDGTVDLNFNYFCADPDQAPEALALNQAFHDYVERDYPRELVLEVSLEPGESVMWHDDRTLHGRNSFTASEWGDRFIWKTGLIVPVAA